MKCGQNRRIKRHVKKVNTFLCCNNSGKMIKCKHSFAIFVTEWEIIGE